MNSYLEDLPSLTDEGLSALHNALIKEKAIRKEEQKKMRRYLHIENRQVKVEEKHRKNSANFISSIVAPLGLRNEKNSANGNTQYLEPLLRQDWSALFSETDSQNVGSNYYVYAHIDPRSTIFVTSDYAGGNYAGIPFYIGKGCNGRAWDLKRNQGHGRMLRAIKKEGYSANDIVKIIHADLTEAEAFEAESKLIYFFGTVYEKERKNGTLVNLEIPKRPIFIGQMEKIES